MTSVTIHSNRQGVMGEVEAASEAALQELFVDVMVEVAKEGSPRLTGHNASSVWQKYHGNLTWQVGTASGYGAYLELGTKHMPARPYFLPAAEAARHNVEASGKGAWQ